MKPPFNKLAKSKLAGHKKAAAAMQDLSATSRALQQAMQQASQAYKARDWVAAEKLCRFVLDAQADYFDALNLLGIIAAQTQRTAEAAHWLGRAAAVNPHEAAVHNNLGNVFKELNRWDEALASYEQAIKFKADYAEAYYNRGKALKALQRFNEALTSYDSAIKLQAGFAEAYNDRGNILRALKRWDEALSSFEQAIRLNANYADAYNNRGNALKDLKRLDEALTSYAQAILLKPGYAETYSNRGNTLRDLMRWDEALSSYERAIQLQADDADVHWNLSLLLLLLGNFSRGWEEYAWRWKRKEFTSKPLQTNRPEWQLGDAKERLLIWSEQGVGDEVMFGALLPNSQTLATQLLVQIDPRLLPIFQRSMPEIAFLPKNVMVDEKRYDRHMAMGSLGRYLCGDLEAFKSIQPNYLLADKDRAKEIRASLYVEDAQLIGISWKSKNETSGGDRSLALKNLVGMLAKPDVKFVNLQYGDVAHELAGVKTDLGIEILQCQTVDNFTDLDGLAALIDACDLVISADNSTVHLAGALGKPVWVLLPLIPDWRWLLGREDSVWYPSARLFRQEAMGDWASVIARVSEALQAHTNAV